MKINFTKNKRDSKAWLDNVVKGKRTAKPDKKPDKKPEKKKVDFSDRAPNTQRMAAEAAYRAKRQMKTAHSLSAFDEGRLKQLEKNVKKSPVMRFQSGFLRDSVGLGLISEKGMDKKVKNSLSYKAGKVAGTIASFATGYGGLSKVLAKGSAKKIAKGSIGQAIRKAGVTNADEVEKMAVKAKDIAKFGKTERKATTDWFLKNTKGAKTAEDAAVEAALKERAKAKGSMIDKIAESKPVKSMAKKQLAKEGIKEGSRDFEKHLAKTSLDKAEKIANSVKTNVIGEATVGTGIGATHAIGDGKKFGSKEFNKEMLENYALGVGTGVGMEALGGVAKAVKNSDAIKGIKESLGIRKVKSLGNGKNVVEIEKDGNITHKVMSDADLESGNIKGNHSADDYVQSKADTESRILRDAKRPKAEIPEPYEAARKVELPKKEFAKHESPKEANPEFKQMVESSKEVESAGSAKDGFNPRESIGREAGYEVSKAADTMGGSPFMTKEAKESFEKWRDEGIFNKKTESHKEALEHATSRVAEFGQDKVANDFIDRVNSGVITTQKDIAEARVCMEHYVETGQYDKMHELMEAVTVAESEAGRTTQAMRLFNSMTPAGKIKTIEKQVQKLSKANDTDIHIPDELYDALKNAKTEGETFRAQKAIAVEAYNQVPASWIEKANAWRYLSMLGNPKTHIRNILGNMIYMPIRKMDNMLATGMEHVLIRNGERTKAIINPMKDKALLERGSEVWDDVSDLLRSSSGKFSDDGVDVFTLSRRPHESKVFDTKVIEFAKNLSGGGLDKEDLFFMRPAFVNAYAQYMKANKINLKTATKEVLERAERYASEEALKSTYRDFSVLSDIVSKAKRYSGMKMKDIPVSPDLSTEMAAKARFFKKAGGVAVEGLMPFVKTPVNILRRGIDHSPVGLARGLGGIIKASKSGDVKVLQNAIYKLAAGTTGTSLMGLGFMLGANNDNPNAYLKAKGSVDYTNKEDSYKQMLGEQGYSITFGDNNYTFDWAAPIALPFFMGVEMGAGKNSSDMIAALTKIQEPVFNLTMLQSLNNAFDSQWSDGSPITNTGKKIVESYAGQFIPTIGGQIARSMTDEAKGTVSTNPNTTIREGERWVNQMKNKVPGLTETNAPKVNAWGETEKNDDKLKSLVQNMFSPGYKKQINPDSVDKELLSLKEKGADNSILPNTKPSGYTIKAGDKELNVDPKEYTTMQKVAGKEAKKQLRELFNSSDYQDMDMAQKEKAISSIYTDAKKKAKVEMLRQKGVSDTDIAWDNDLSPSEKKKYSTKEEFLKDLRKTGVSVMEFENYKANGATLAQLKEAKARGVNVDKYISAKKAMKGSKSYGETFARLMDGGYVKTYDDVQAYDRDARKHTWNTVVKAKNAGWSTQKIASIIGDDTDEKREGIKKYGTKMRGTYEVYTPEALTKWVEKNYKGASRSVKRFAWDYYTYGWSDYVKRNPY